MSNELQQLKNRLRIYVTVRNRLAKLLAKNEIIDFFVCHQLEDTYVNLDVGGGIGLNRYVKYDDFPEFAAQKPKHTGFDNAWWETNLEGHTERLKALNIAIELTEEKIKNYMPIQFKRT